MTDQSWQAYSSTLRRLLQRPKLRDQFQQDIGGIATADLNISPEMRTDLKNILILLDSTMDSSAREHKGGEDDTFERSAMSAENFFQTTYTHLRRGAFATMIMSILIFLMGLFLLAIAASQSLRGDEPGSAVALAASGIVAIAAAFYRSPVSQMRESAAEVQRSSMVLMSYMLGLSLLSRRLSGENTADLSEMLTALTRDLAELLPGK